MKNIFITLALLATLVPTDVVAVNNIVFTASVAVNNTQIVEAARVGDLNAVRNLLNSGININETTGDGMTALHWASHRNDADMVTFLLNSGASTELGTRIGNYTPLHVASRNGSIDAVKLLVNSGADVSAITTNSGVTPLHLASTSVNNSAEIISMLVASGANVNARDFAGGQTPLMFAAGANRPDAALELLKNGADASLTTEVIDVLSSYVRDRAADQALRTALAELRRESGGGSDWRPTPSQLQQAILTQRTVASEKFEVSDVNSLVQNQVRRVNSQRLRVIQPRLPIRHVQVGMAEGMTALVLAAREGNLEVVKAMVSHGVDVNTPTDGTNASALVTATINGFYDLALFLVQNGADPNIVKQPENMSPLFAVLQSQYPGTPTYPQPQFHHLQNTSHYELMEALLAAGADPNVRLLMHLWYWEYNQGRVGLDVTGATPFWRASFARDLRAMELLVRFGADVTLPTTQPAEVMLEARTPDGRQEESSGLQPVPEGAPTMFPIHAASGGGYLGIGASSIEGLPNAFLKSVQYLVEELNADVNVPDSWGYTPLHYAATRGDNELIQYLVEKGADVTAMSRLGMSPADMARGGQRGFFMQSALPDTEKLLVSLGSPLLCKDLHFDGTGDVCPTAGTSVFEDLYGFSRTPLYQRPTHDKWGWEVDETQSAGDPR